MIPYPWEIPKKKFLWESPLFSYGKFPAFLFQKPHGESPPFFSVGNSPPFYQSPYGKSPKKSGKKIFSSGYMDNCSLKNGGAPWGEGAWGDTYPPLWDIWGGRLLIKITC